MHGMHKTVSKNMRMRVQRKKNAMDVGRYENPNYWRFSPGKRRRTGSIQIAKFQFDGIEVVDKVQWLLMTFECISNLSMPIRICDGR